MVCLVVGDVNADLAASLESFPHEGDDAAITTLGFYSGGTAANVAVAHARLGGEARLLARAGNDPAAEVAVRASKRAGVDTSFLQYDPQLTTGLCFAAVSANGERTFFSWRGANVALELPDMDEVFRGARWLHLSGHALLEGHQRSTALLLLEMARKRGLSTSIDLCLPLIRKRADEILMLAPLFSVIFANERELELLGSSLGLSFGTITPLEATFSALLHAGAPLVVAKLGAAGSRIAQGSSRIDISPHSVGVKDTTGAGDGFVAAFLFTLLRRGSVEVAAEVGNVVGALVASRRGAADASPSRDEVCAVLETRGARKALDVFANSAQKANS